MIRSALMLLLLAPLGWAATDSALLAMLPPQVRSVAGIQVTQAKPTAFGQFLASSPMWSSSDFQKLTAQTGFDPRRDLDSVLFFADAGPSHEGHPHGGVLARGSFDSAKLISLAVKQGFTPTDLNGQTAYLAGGPGGAKHGFLFTDVDVAALGDLQTLTEIAANHAAPASLDPEMSKLITRASDGRDAWFATKVPSFAGTPHQASASGSQDSALAQALQKIVAATGGLMFGNDLQLFADATSTSEKDATALGDVIRFLASSASSQQSTDPHAALVVPALQQLKIDVQSRDVHLSTTLPEANLEALLQLDPHSNSRHSRAQH